jgi:autotransporter-associated beta strand protein
VTLKGGATPAGTTQTISGVISDGSMPGVVDMTGAGTLVLSGANTYSGGTTISAGTLQATNNSSVGSGKVTLDGGAFQAGAAGLSFSNAFAINTTGGTIDTQAYTLTLSSAIGNGTGSTGALTKIGSGNLILSGTSSYTGATNVNAGALEVDGSIASSTLTTVASGATLLGVGTVGNLQINGGGTFAPGAAGSPGTAMTVQGNLAFQSGAIYLVQINPSNSTVTNVVTGTATLAGNVLAAFASGSYLTKTYTILTAGSVSGTFASLGTTNLPANFTAKLSYNASNVQLNLTAVMASGSGSGSASASGSSSVTGTSYNTNNAAVAGALDNFFNTGGTLTPNFLNIFAMTGGNLTNALAQLSGQAETAGEQASFSLMTGFLGLMLDPTVTGRSGGTASGASGFAPEQQASFPPDIAIAYDSVLEAPPSAPPSFDQRWSAWGSGFGGYNRTDGNAAAGTNDVTVSTYGGAGGLDYHFTPYSVAGFALAGSGTNWSLAQNLGGGRSDAFQAGVYGVQYLGPAYIAAALGFTNNWMTTNRIALGDQLQARFMAQSYGGRLEAGYRIGTPAIGMTPYAAGQAQIFAAPRYSETDLTGGGFGLTYGATTADDIRSEVGARFDATVPGAMPLVFRARGAWAHDWISNPSLDAVFQSLPGSSFIVNGATPPKDSALASASAEFFVTRNLSLLTKFDGEFATTAQTYAGSETLRFSW